jgi:type III secretory pathway component EscT
VSDHEIADRVREARRDHDRAEMNMALSLIGIGFILGVLAAMLFHALFIAGQVSP